MGSFVTVNISRRENELISRKGILVNDMLKHSVIGLWDTTNQYKRIDLFLTEIVSEINTKDLIYDKSDNGYIVITHSTFHSDVPPVDDNKLEEIINYLKL